MFKRILRYSLSYKAELVTYRSTIAGLRILVVDDHGIVREGLAALLERDDRMRIVGFAATGEEAVIAALSLRPDVVIMDLVLPGLNGIDATQRILRDAPGTRILALSACQSTDHVYRALRAGALGYVLKSAVGAELLRAVEAVSTGDRYISSALASSFTDGELRTPIPDSPFERLSIREREVLRSIVAGSTSADIAQRLSLSRKTIDTYRSRIMVKLGVANRAALIHFALQYDLPAV